jgi:membrane protease YdiL (CAAX protease family)
VGSTAVDRRARVGLWLFGAAIIGLSIGTALGFWDVIGLAFFYVLLPALGWVQLPLMRSVVGERLQVYGTSAFSTVTIGLVALAFASALGPGENVRIGLGGLSPGALLGWTGGVAVVCLALILAFEPADRRARDPGSDLVLQLIPRTGREKVAFVGLSAAAGFGEELAYRGYALAAAQLLIPVPWVAALLSSVPFAALHAYQGRIGIVRTALVGLVLAVPVLATGSLLPSMCAHAAVDIVAGLVIGPWLVSRSGPAEATGGPRSEVAGGTLPAGE